MAPTFTVGRAAVGASAPAVAATPTHLIRARSTNPGDVVISRREPGGDVNRRFPVTEVHEFEDRTGRRIALVVSEDSVFAFTSGALIEVAGSRPTRTRRVQR